MNFPKKMRSLFEKRQDFQNLENLKIPENVFTCEKWSLPAFQNQKEELNKTKSLLSDFDLEEWSKHTKNRDPSSFIMRFVKQKFQPELVTQAWCKFYEILNTFPIIPKDSISGGQFSSLHLCEAPGAFITSLNHFIRTLDINLEWKWFANTLNPYYEGNSLSEMIPDDRLLKHAYANWYFGLDFTGDITKYYNHLDLLDKIDKVWLVTADGSIDCSQNPGDQEKFVEYLHYCETLTALSLLKENGSFVLKIFTTFEDSTICLLYLLLNLFKKVSIFKPASSKSGNSEVYVVCLEFKSDAFHKKRYLFFEPYKSGKFEPNKSMFDLNDISKDFLNQLLCFSDYFMKKQIERINDNVANFRNESEGEARKIHQTKVYVANRYIHKFRLKKISQNQKIVPNCDISQFLNIRQSLCFENGVFKIEVRNLISETKHFELDIKIGRRISEVVSSRFCKSELLSKFNFCRKRKKSFLYENITQRLKTTKIINFDDLDFDSYPEFQNFFVNLWINTRKNILLVKVPLITNFLVGLFLIVTSLYEFVYVHKSGFLLLFNFKYNQEVINMLKKIKNACKTLDSGNYISDLVYVVSPDCLNHKFFEFIWNYNNVVLSKM